MNASGNVSLGSHVISAGMPLAGQRITLRLDGPVAHILTRGTLTRTRRLPHSTSYDIRRHKASHYPRPQAGRPIRP